MSLIEKSRRSLPWGLLGHTFTRKHAYRSVPDEAREGGSQKELELEPRARGPQCLRWCVSAVCCSLVILALVLYFVPSPRDRHYPSFSPNFKTQSVVFEQNKTYAALPSPESNAAWDNLIPDGQGYVLIPNAAERYGLLPGIGTDDGPDRFAVSVYHQIHCLGMIRLVYFDMIKHVSKEGQRSGLKSTPETQESHPHIRKDHVAHCFDYLRQALMCAGDMTIEHAREPPLGQKRLTTDGWGVTHQCRDWDELEAWTLAHKANVSHTGIQIGT